MDFRTLPGFREFYPEILAARNEIFSRWRSAARSFGFKEFEPPVLEELSLFTEKSGEEIRSQLFEFVDKGGREVALRPEMTPSLARMVGSKAGGLRKPVKWFAIGENYRYERQQKGRLRAFYQYNADILGDDSVACDAEIMALLVASLESLGLTKEEFKVRLGDRKLWVLFLKSRGVPEDYVVPVLSAADKMAKISPEAFSEVLSGSLKGSGVDSDALAREIRNFASINDFSELEKFFEGISKGEDSELLARLEDWKVLFESLENLGKSDFVVCDMGIVRGLAYYTGFVFEAFQTVGTGRALAGGGRYDSLVRKLGYQDLPAVGFGMGDVTVSDLLELVGKKPKNKDALDAFLIIGSPSLRKKALNIASSLRGGGISVEYPFKDSGFGKQFKQADSSGAKFALILGEDEAEKGVVKIKNLSSGEEVFVKETEVRKFLSEKSKLD